MSKRHIKLFFKSVSGTSCCSSPKLVRFLFTSFVSLSVALSSTLPTLSAISILSVGLSPSFAFAQHSSPLNMAATSVREFYVARDMGKPLLTVHLLNGVTSPGVYHIPVDTDVAQLIAYAGGAVPTSDLSEITVRRGKGNNLQITSLDLEKALRSRDDLFHMHDQDIVQIEQKFNAEKPLQYVGIISAIASVVLSVYLVRDIENRK